MNDVNDTLNKSLRFWQDINRHDISENALGMISAGHIDLRGMIAAAPKAPWVAYFLSGCHRQISNADRQLVELMVREGADPWAADENVSIPSTLESLINTDSADLIDLWLRRRDTPSAEVLNSHAKTPGMVWAANTNLPIIDLLLQHGFSIDDLGPQGIPPIARFNNTDHVQNFLDRGARMDTKGAQGQSIMDIWAKSFTLEDQQALLPFWRNYARHLRGLTYLRQSLPLVSKGAMRTALRMAKIKGHEVDEHGHTLLTVLAEALAKDSNGWTADRPHWTAHHDVVEEVWKIAKDTLATHRTEALKPLMVAMAGQGTLTKWAVGQWRALHPVGGVPEALPSAEGLGLNATRQAHAQGQIAARALFDEKNQFQPQAWVTQHPEMASQLLLDYFQGLKDLGRNHDLTDATEAAAALVSSQPQLLEQWPRDPWDVALDIFLTNTSQYGGWESFDDKGVGNEACKIPQSDLALALLAMQRQPTHATLAKWVPYMQENLGDLKNRGRVNENFFKPLEVEFVRHQLHETIAEAGGERVTRRVRL